jgi:hypothetical protein
VGVDGVRSGYPEEQEHRWFPGDRGYGERYGDERRYDEDRYRVPEPRYGDADPLDPRTPIGPRSGVELPPYEPEPAYPPGEPTGEHHTQPIDRGALRRPPVEPAHGAPTPTVYKARRAGVFGLLAVVAMVAELLLVRVLVTGEFGRVVSPGAVLGALFAMVGIPFLVIGLHALITAPSAASGPNAALAWLRAPLAYLPIGLVLLIAAGLATS